MERDNRQYGGEVEVIEFGVNKIHVMFTYGRFRMWVPYSAEDMLHEKFSVGEVLHVFLEPGEGFAKLSLEIPENPPDVIDFL
jgi:hypothetical protein